MNVESNIKFPPFEIVQTLDGMAFCRFYDEVTEQVLENDEIKYLAACYEIKTKYSPKLYDRINKNIPLWLDRAKEENRIKQDSINEINKIEKIPDRVTTLENENAEMTCLLADMIGGGA